MSPMWSLLSCGMSGGPQTSRMYLSIFQIRWHDALRYQQNTMAESQLEEGAKQIHGAYRTIEDAAMQYIYDPAAYCWHLFHCLKCSNAQPVEKKMTRISKISKYV